MAWYGGLLILGSQLREGWEVMAFHRHEGVYVHSGSHRSLDAAVGGTDSSIVRHYFIDYSKEKYKRLTLILQWRLTS